MNTKIIEELQLLVAAAFRLESKAFSDDFWQEQIDSMIKITRDLSREYGADEEIVLIATLLHHFSALKGPETTMGGGASFEDGAEALLSRLGYPEERIQIVKSCFAPYRKNNNSPATSAEITLMADAKAFAHIQALASLFLTVYKHMGLGQNPESERINRKLRQDWDRVSEIGKKVYKEKYEKIVHAIT